MSLTRRLIGIAGVGGAEAPGDYLVSLEGAGERGMSHRVVVEQFQAGVYILENTSPLGGGE